MTEIECQSLVELVTDYLEGVLDPATVQRVNDHLEVCDGCENYVAQVRATIRISSSLRDVPASTDAIDTQLLELHRQWLSSKAG